MMEEYNYKIVESDAERGDTRHKMQPITSHQSHAASGEPLMREESLETNNYRLKTYPESILIDVREMFRQIVLDLGRGVPRETIAARFHNTVASFIVAICNRIRAENNVKEVALSGGTFQNRYLLTRICDQLTEGGFTPYIHKKVPTNDGGVSLGQAVIANAQLS
jgi:hydrogenase maturation protein HypF